MRIIPYVCLIVCSLTMLVQSCFAGWQQTQICTFTFSRVNCDNFPPKRDWNNWLRARLTSKYLLWPYMQHTKCSSFMHKAGVRQVREDPNCLNICTKSIPLFWTRNLYGPFFPLVANALVLSHPVNTLNADSACAISYPISFSIPVTSILLRFVPLPVSKRTCCDILVALLQVTG